MQGFKDFIDALGGITIRVDEDLVMGDSGKILEVRGLPGSATPPPEPVPVEGTCAGTDYLICLDFEDVAAGQRPAGYGVDGSASNVQVVSGGEARSGSNSLRVSSNGAGNYGYLTRPSFPGTHWGRLYYKLGSVPNTGGYLHGTFVAAYGGGGEFRFVDTVQDPQGRHQYIYNVEPGDLSLQGDYGYVFNNDWVCVEWQMDAAQQRWHFFRDGTELSFTGSATDPSTRMTPRRSNCQATAPGSASDPPLRLKIVLISAPVRLRLSVSTSTSRATPFGA